MTRDYVNYKSKRQRQTRRGLVLCLVLVGCALLPGLAFYLHRQNLTVTRFQQETAQKLAAYFPHLQQEKKPPAAKKAVPATAESPKPIHFSFYDELPKGQLETTAPMEAPVLAVKTKKIQPLAVAAATPPPVSPPSPAREEAAQEKAELEPAILQLSVFHSLEAAKRYRAALASAGLKVDLVTLRVGKKVIYRLQQGPYSNREQLKLAKKHLAERGISCDLRKSPP